jgi:hypothetical protein
MATRPRKSKAAAEPTPVVEPVVEPTPAEPKPAEPASTAPAPEIPVVELGDIRATDNIADEEEPVSVPNVPVSVPNVPVSAPDVKARTHGDNLTNPVLDEELKAMQIEEKQLLDHRLNRRARSERLNTDAAYREGYQAAQEEHRNRERERREQAAMAEPVDAPVEGRVIADAEPDDSDAEPVGTVSAAKRIPRSVFQFLDVKRVEIHYHSSE